MRGARREIAHRLRAQAGFCASLDSPLYATLLERAARDVEDGGAVWAVLEGCELDPPGSALALRFMGAVHRLVLRGAAPELATFYSAAGGRRDPGGAWGAFRDTVSNNAGLLRQLVRRPVQTNEVGRSAALLGGFLIVGTRFRLALRILEIGASAGLNLRWDHFRYEAAGWSWGVPSSPLRFRDVFAGDARPPAAQVGVHERAACDAAPIDPFSDEGRETLIAYTWPDQQGRLMQLRAALEVAAAVPAPVEQADAVEWLSQRLAAPADGLATVVFHSIVAQYLGGPKYARLAELLHRAGARSTGRAPLAWLRMEPERIDDPGGRFLVQLTMWPPGRSDDVIAEAHPHGPPVRWLAPRE